MVSEWYPRFAVKQRKRLKTRLSHRVFSCYDNARRIVCDVNLEEILVVNILRAQELGIEREFFVAKCRFSF